MTETVITKLLDLDVFVVHVADLEPNPWNPNRMDEATYRAERESIRRFGFIDPITARPHPEHEGKWQIIDGEHRWRAAQDEGFTEVSVASLGPISDAEAQKLTVILNETRGSADDAKLAQLLKRLDEEVGRDELMLGLPYAKDDMERMLARAELAGGGGEGIDLEDVPEPPGEPVSKRGEVYELGPHRLMCGDSAEIEDVQILMAGQQAHMVMADPPYNVGYIGGSSAGSPGGQKQREDAYEDDRGADYGPWLTRILENGNAWSDDSAALHLWFGVVEIDAVLKAIDASGWEKRAMVLWSKVTPDKGMSTGTVFAQYKPAFEPFWYCHKKGKSPRWHGPTNEVAVWFYQKPHKNELHPVMRPVEMYQREIENHTQAGHSVLEMFGGSGTTLMACEVSARRAFLMEISPAYCDVIRGRWEKYEKAKANMEWSQEQTS